MSKTRIHCYGCPAVVAVDERLPDQGLRAARWCNEHGETFCPSCAQGESLPDPWDSEPPWTDHHPKRSNSAEALAAARESRPLGPAIEDPETGAAVSRYGRRAWLWLAGAVAVLAATIAFMGIHTSEANHLLRTGVRTPGVVEGYSWRREGGEILVRYRANGEIRFHTINVSESEQYAPGEQVQVIYDPSDPSQIRTRTDSNESRLATRVTIYGWVFSVALLLAGLTVLARPLRWRRLLRSPWKAYSATYIPGRSRRSGPGVTLIPLDEPGVEPVSLRLAATMRQRAVKLAGEPVLWAVGSPDSRVVLAIPRTRELYMAVSPRGYLGRRWLAAQKPTTPRERRAARAYLALIAFVSGAAAVLAVSYQEWLTALACATNAVVFGWVLVRAIRSRPRGVTMPNQRH